MTRKLGMMKAIIYSSIAFGIYHWFSFGIFGNPAQMAVVFFITASMGLVLAFGYCKTYSLYIPFAIHLGWNFTQIFIFSDGPIGKGIFIQANNHPFRTGSWLIFITVTFLPLILVLLTNFFLIRKHKQESLPR